jgi:hypothetical protein
MVDRLDEELLFVQRIGVGGVPVLIGRCFEVTDRGQVPGVGGGPKATQVVLVVAWSVRPIISVELGGRWCGLAVDG